MVRIALIHSPPPPVQAPNPVADLPLLPGSDALILGVYQWTVAHSVSLQGVVRQLAAADGKARYRLLPGLGARFEFTVSAADGEYQVDIEVPILAWTRCQDALEPWIASSLFLALEVISKEKYRGNPNPHQYVFLPSSIRASFVFQSQVRRELQAIDPLRLKDLPDGARLYNLGFPPSSSLQEGPSRRPLPMRPPLEPKPDLNPSSSLPAPDPRRPHLP